MTGLQTATKTDTWVVASWDEFVRSVEDPIYEKARCYYYDGQMRIEMSPVGASHARDDSLIDNLINLFTVTKGIPAIALSNCSYRKVRVRECQPDISYYLNERVRSAPQGNSIVNLDNTPAPDLAIEIASTTLADDLGKKRLLYEELRVTEYWVVDVDQAQIIAFNILENLGSQRISKSQVLPGLDIALLEEALQRSREQDNTQVSAWFMAEVQKA
jgi:Uma2 family endonuclease